MNAATTIRPFIAVVTMALASCAGYHVRKGDQAHARMAYSKAERHYEKVAPTAMDRATILRAADACRRQGEVERATAWYRRADSLGRVAGDDAMCYGQALMGKGELEQAAELFLRVLEERPEDAAAMDLFNSCKHYEAFLRDSARFVVNALNLPGLLNAFAAIPYRNGVLVAGEQDVPATKANPWNGFSFLDLYYCEKKTVVRWNEATPLPKAVNGPYHEGPAVTSPDGRSLYFTRSNYQDRGLGKDSWNTSHLKLFRASLDSTGVWSDIRSFAFNGEDFSVGHPSLSSDGRTLYFASDMPGGLGGSDIWRSVDNGTGWSRPENLGATVNTPGNELFPSIHGDVLYFASSAHANMGGLDIFESHLQGASWSRPSNLNYPINTRYDDFAFVVDTTVSPANEGRAGYLSSNRDGHDQVYSFWAYQPTFLVEGVVKDDSAHFLPNITVTLTEMLTDQDVMVTTDENGRFAFKLAPNTDYTVRAEGDDYIARSEPISTKGRIHSDTLEIGFALTPARVNATITLENIYFDYDKWDLRPESTTSLDQVARMIADNPNISFELGAHTDSRGGDLYNLVLSDARAMSAVNYLIQQGVDPGRIAAAGYGETDLVNWCEDGAACTEEQHQDNRRVEFKVTSIKDVAQKR